MAMFIILFFELGLNFLLKPSDSDAVLSYITSNKWMRAGYGATHSQII